MNFSKKSNLKTVPTPKQKAVLDFMHAYQARKGFAPSRREIAEGLGLSSVATVQEHVESLVEKGLVDRTPERTARGLSLTQMPPLFGEKTQELPLVGRVAAGYPIEAIETYETVSVPDMFIGGKGVHFVLQVTGESMIEDGILDGDFVVIEKTDRARNGQTVVALIDGEATIKRYESKKGEIELHPANANFDVIRVDPTKSFQVAGVLKGVFRKYE